MVSSCAHLPWMMLVWLLRACVSTAFHTCRHRHGHSAGWGVRVSVCACVRACVRQGGGRGCVRSSRVTRSEPYVTKNARRASRGARLGHPGAGGVHNLYAAVVQQLHLVHAGAEGGQDDHLAVLHARKVFAALGLLNELDAHLRQTLPGARGPAARDARQRVRKSGVARGAGGARRAIPHGRHALGFAQHENAAPTPPCRRARAWLTDGL